MQTPFSWVKKLFGGDGKAGRVLALFSPPAVRERGPLVRFAVAGGTIAAIVVAGAIGMGALAVLLSAIGVVWFLATQVLGLQVNVDPAAFYQTMQRQAAAAAYGAN